MRVLYDYQIFEMHSFGGISNGLASIISNLPKDIQYKIAINFSENIHLKENGLFTSYYHYKERYERFLEGLKFKGKGRLFRFWYSFKYPEEAFYRESNKDFSIRLLKKCNYDIFHPTFYDDYFLSFLGNKPFVLTIHDMIPELFPEYFPRNDLQIINKRKLVKKAAHIIAPSENTKKDIITMLRIPSSNISVVHWGKPSLIEIDSQKYNFPYILFVGNRSGYKNFIPFIRDCARIIQKIPYIKVVCTGTHFNHEEKQIITSLGIDNNVIHTFVSSDEYYSIYKYALAFVFPSLYEGFGLPILEAFSCGCPVLLNNRSCFPEIAGNAAIYFEMDNSFSNFYETFMSFLSFNERQINELIEKGYKRLAKYSWEKATRQYSDIYKNNCNK